MEMSYETDLIGNETRRTLAYPGAGGKSKGGQSEICSLTGREGGRAWGLEDRCATLPPSLAAFLRRNFFPGKASRVDCLPGRVHPSQPIHWVHLYSFLDGRTSSASPSEGVPMEVSPRLLLIGLFRDFRKGKCAEP